MVDPCGHTYALPTQSTQQDFDKFIASVLRAVRTALWVDTIPRYCGGGLLSPPHPASFRLLQILEGWAKGMMECILAGGLWLPDRIATIQQGYPTACPLCAHTSCEGPRRLFWDCTVAQSAGLPAVDASHHLVIKPGQYT